MKVQPGSAWEYQDIDFLHEIGKRLSLKPDPLHKVLARIVQFVSSLVKCDSLSGLHSRRTRISCCAPRKNPHRPEVVGHLTLQNGSRQYRAGSGEHKKPVAPITRKAYMDPRFESFSELPEDRFEAFLSRADTLSQTNWSASSTCSIVNSHISTSQKDIQLISTEIGFLVEAPRN